MSLFNTTYTNVFTLQDFAGLASKMVSGLTF
ncbi:hypothetical protein CAEBREN_11584 [Caenorhabditis brenneri]|uniref:Uncharacterized protein n=1 Tax=Caenorhabditis brenneri TaxID=135651 RepID=G0MC38_CAEBE|nr:hypothetical protein CAEBREN_11584 [Caenorhabditis brenneri]